jgi:hypothetical protein
MRFSPKNETKTEQQRTSRAPAPPKRLVRRTSQADRLMQIMHPAGKGVNEIASEVTIGIALRGFHRAHVCLGEILISIGEEAQRCQCVRHLYSMTDLSRTNREIHEEFMNRA